MIEIKTQILKQINIRKNLIKENMNLTQEQIDYLRKCHVQVALPCYAGQVFESVMISMIKFVIYAGKLGMNFSVDTMVNESLIPRGRNGMSAKFYENQAATHMMFIDSDIGFDPENIFQLLLHDKDIVGGLYPKKTLPIDYVVNVSPDAVDPTNGQVKVENGLIEVSRLGTGFMLMKRDVFTRMFAAYPNKKYNNNIGLDKKYDPFMYALFDCAISPDTLEYLSEDWYFADLFRAIGGKCYVDPNIRLRHSGFFSYPGRPEQLQDIFKCKPDAEGNITFNTMPRIAVRQDVLQTNGVPVMPNLPAKNTAIAGPVLTIPTPESIANIDVTTAIDINKDIVKE